MFDEKKKQEVLKAFSEGTNVTDISKEYRVAVATIYRWLSKVGYSKENKELFHKLRILKQEQNIEEMKKIGELLEATPFYQQYFKPSMEEKNVSFSNEEIATFSNRMNITSPEKVIANLEEEQMEKSMSAIDKTPENSETFLGLENQNPISKKKKKKSKEKNKNPRLKAWFFANAYKAWYGRPSFDGFFSLPIAFDSLTCP